MSSREIQFGTACPTCKRLNLADESQVGTTLVCVACDASILVERPSSDRLGKTVLPAASGETAMRAEIDQRATFGEQQTVSYQDFAEKDWDRKRRSPRRDGSRMRNVTLAISGIGFICSVVLVVYLVSGDESTTQTNLVARDPIPDPRMVAEQFLFANSAEKRLNWVRNPHIHEAAIRQLFDSTKLERSSARSLREMTSVAIVDGIITSFHAKFDDDTSRLVCVLDENVYGKRVVDWEAFARSGTASWDQLLAGQVQAAEVRVFARPIGPAIFPHGNKDTAYFEYALTSPDLDREVSGFVERGTRTGLTLVSALAGPDQPLRRSMNQRMTLLIETLNASHTQRQFLINRIIAKGWVKGLTDLEIKTILPSETEPTEADMIEAEADRMLQRTRSGLEGFIRSKPASE